jgi:hypothetical protein
MNNYAYELLVRIKAVPQTCKVECPKCQREVSGKHWRGRRHFSGRFHKCGKIMRTAKKKALKKGVPEEIAAQAWIAECKIIRTDPSMSSF